MNFRPELAAAVMAGRKTVTRRLASGNPRSPWSTDRCGLIVGCDYAICPGRGKRAIGRARVVSVSLERLGELDERDAVREGFDDVEDFIEAWHEINGSYNPNALVWRVELEAIR